MLTIVNDTTYFIKTVVFGKTIVFEKNATLLNAVFHEVKKLCGELKLLYIFFLKTTQ